MQHNCGKKQVVNTLAWCKHLKPHNRMQIQLATISRGHAVINVSVESAEFSLQLLVPGHMPLFQQQSHTADQKENRPTFTLFWSFDYIKGFQIRKLK